MKPLPLSPWQQFRKKWSNGCGSDLCQRAMNVCLVRKGSHIPCDLLFIAQSPGESEDASASVLCGPAGKWFDINIGALSIPEGISVAYSNLIGCMPTEEGSTAESKHIDVKDIEKCSERLKDFIVLCNPKLIICIGTLSRDWLDRKGMRGYKLYWEDIDRRLGREIPVEAVLHPSWIMQQDEVLKTLEKRRAILTIKSSIDKYILGKKDDEDE